MSTATQSNTQVGDLPFVAGLDLTEMGGRLVKIDSASGKPVVVLPEAETDLTPFVLTEGGAAGALVTVRPLEAGRNVRLVLDGTCEPGDVLVAMVGGKVQALPTDAGTYRPVAVAEEAGAAGQWVLGRPLAIGEITVDGDLGV